jgi:hypothetical protein
MKIAAAEAIVEQAAEEELVPEMLDRSAHHGIALAMARASAAPDARRSEAWNGNVECRMGGTRPGR